MSHGDILGTKSGIIDPLVSKRPESNYEEEEKNIKQSTIMKLPRYIGMELLKSGEGGWGLKKHPTWSNISIVKHFGGKGEKSHIFRSARTTANLSDIVWCVSGGVWSMSGGVWWCLMHVWWCLVVSMYIG